MKTLILATVSTVALLSAGAAFAADPATPTPPTTQIGTGGSEANISQLIDQVGNSNNASINQVGSSNSSSVVLQDSGVNGSSDPGAGARLGAGSYYNSATVTQSGSGARSLVVQASTSGAGSETATVAQGGSNEYAFVYQDATPHGGSGFGNKATISQSSSNNSHGAGNLFGVNDRASNAGAKADATYAQGLTGSTLDAWATTGSGAYGATIVETGAVNTDSIIQHGQNNAALTTNAADFDTSSINQADGTYNDVAAIRRTGDADFSKGYITQYGNGESASIEQLNGGFTLNSTATINQYGGSGQTARITQSGAAGFDNATINQYGSSSNSFARTTQDGMTGTADTEQYGNSDFALTTQHAVKSTANVTQTGSLDASIITQGTTGAAGGYGNTANVTQSGYNDYSKVTQTGGVNTSAPAGLSAALITAPGGNTATVNQSGMFDVSLITQTGGVNTADVASGGYKAFSSVTQVGVANNAYVRQ